MSLLEEREHTFCAEFDKNGQQHIFLPGITDEDLEVTERWLIKVSVIDNDGLDEEEGILVSRKLVYELIQKIEVNNNDASMELCFEVSKLPKIYLTDEQIKLLRSDGRFEVPIFGLSSVKVYQRPEDNKKYSGCIEDSFNKLFCSVEKGGKENE